MNLLFSQQISKDNVFDGVKDELVKHNLSVINNEKRPWGGFFVIAESEASNFLDTYFPSLNKNELIAANKLSPKILIVEAGKRLSWQYHFRRAEIWKVIGGAVGIIRSDDDEEKPLEIFNSGDIIKLKQGERHRLIGLNNWGIIAEIWQHTNKENPSDEEDIVRLSDDFGR
jgi:mannose-6-phosphate isomerase-like protein (cupin superfamily)